MRTDLDIEKFRKILVDEKASIQEQISQEMNLLSSSSDLDPDMLDNATEMANRDRRLEWLNLLNGRLGELGEALLRVETGKFGICTRCGEEINLERLEAKPYARFCIRCREKIEERRH